jgi:hypothetical protein
VAYPVQIGQRVFYGMRGNVHMHTTLSDGTTDHDQLARTAGEAGLDFIIVTDHNVYQPGLEGWRDNTLVLVGEEVHDPQREPQSSHLLCFGIDKDVASHAAHPQAVIDAVNDQGGFTFLAHPFERDVAEFLPEPNISWRDWGVTGYAGLEVWNYMSEFKSVLKNRAQALLYAYAPGLAISGPYPETLEKWDQLLRDGRISALGGSDAHGTVYHLGPLARQVLPYDYLFRAVNTHLLSPKPLVGDLAHDRRVVYEALRDGHGFLGYEQSAPLAGFAFWAQSGGAEATMGEELHLAGRTVLRARLPGPGRIRLLRNGEVLAQAQGCRLDWVGQRTGAYRLEAYRRYAGQWRTWIVSNPIYVRRTGAD